MCEWVRELKGPDGYASSIGKCVDTSSKRLIGMKSNDCHVFMECLLPNASSAFPEPIWKPLTKLNQFFRYLCSTTLQEDRLLQMEENIHMILCKLLCIFPYAFFDSMPHLPIHLPYEARIGGEYHCKHPFERYSILYHLLLYNVPINWYCIFYLGFKIKLKEL